MSHVLNTTITYYVLLMFFCKYLYKIILFKLQAKTCTALNVDEAELNNNKLKCTRNTKRLN